MTTLAIRQSRGASIVSLPKALLKALGLGIGGLLDLSIDDHKIVLTPVHKALTLDAVLAGSPKDRLAFIDEDQQWLQAGSRGKEEIT